MLQNLVTWVFKTMQRAGIAEKAMILLSSMDFVDKENEIPCIMYAYLIVQDIETRKEEKFAGKLFGKRDVDVIKDQKRKSAS